MTDKTRDIQVEMYTILKRIDKDYYGNGREGTKDKVERIETELNQKEKDLKFNITLWGVIIAAVSVLANVIF